MISIQKINDDVFIFTISRAKKFNFALTNKEIKKYCQIEDTTGLFLENIINKFGLSIRSYNKILKISRTVADLEAAEHISLNHVKEAISFRFRHNILENND